MGKLYRYLAARGAKKRLTEARRLLEDVTPLKRDCGRLCGGACCQSDESGQNGMLLYPFEESFYRKPIEGFDFRLVDDDTLTKGGKRLICEGSCPREHRPLKCRLFPLRLRVVTDDDGATAHCEAELEPAAWAVCPLCEQGVQALSQAFVAAAKQAGDELIRQTDLLEALYHEQEIIDETRKIFF